MELLLLQFKFSRYSLQGQEILQVSTIDLSLHGIGYSSSCNIVLPLCCIYVVLKATK